jgi:hypothetical protein
MHSFPPAHCSYRAVHAYLGRVQPLADDGQNLITALQPNTHHYGVQCRDAAQAHVSWSVATLRRPQGPRCFDTCPGPENAAEEAPRYFADQNIRRGLLVTRCRPISVMFRSGTERLCRSCSSSCSVAIPVFRCCSRCRMATQRGPAMSLRLRCSEPDVCR